MNFTFLDRRSAERFAELLDETTGGRRHHGNRGQADEPLAELVAIGHSLSAAKPGVRVDPEFRVGLRAMLVATAERDGIGRTATTASASASVSGSAATSVSSPFSRPDSGETGRATDDEAGSGGRLGVLGLGGRRIRARGAIVIGVAAGALAVSGISAASENASPGDPLYGVKRSTERAQLAMAGSDVTRGQLSLNFARTRLAEAASMAGGDQEFDSVLDDMDEKTRTGVQLLTTSAVARKDASPLATVENFADTQRQTIAPVLDRLTPANRERAEQSIGLLDDVHQRAEDLRGGLSCTSITSIGADLLGPRLRSCAAQPDGASGAGRTPGHSGKSTAKPTRQTTKTRPEVTGPAAAPDATAGTSVPGVQDSAGTDLAPVDVTPSQSETPDDTSTDVDKGITGGLLGGVLGSN